jgi:hypothetical protein
MTTKKKMILSAMLLVLGIVCRLLPHMWNFAPIAAIAIFSGIYLGRNYALTLPAVTMFLGDLFLGFYSWPLMATVYGSYLVIGLLGIFVSKHKSLETVLASSLLSSVFFFVATNWAVWQFSPWYAKSMAGLINCYTLALPFLRGTLLSDLFYISILCGAYELVSVLVNKYKVAFVAVKNI